MFTDADDEKAPRVAIVNEAAARVPAGVRKILLARGSFNNGETWITIVGVVSNVKQYGLEKEATEEIYSPVAQAPFGSFLVIKTREPNGRVEANT